MKTMRLGVLTATALLGLGGLRRRRRRPQRSQYRQLGGQQHGRRLWRRQHQPLRQLYPGRLRQAVRGSFDGTNCIYGSGFVGAANPLLVDLTIPFITGNHIFQDSLFVGQNVNTGVALQEGEGPTLTIAAGNTLVFQDAFDYVLVNRGSQIIANGSPTSPITFTSFTDAITGTAGGERRAAVGRHRHQRQRDHQQLLGCRTCGRPCHVVSRASLRTMAAATTPRVRAASSTSS